jgi:hypothetical protein
MKYGLSFTDKVHIVVQIGKQGPDRYMATLCNGKGILMWDEIREEAVKPKQVCRICRRIA